MAQKYNPFAEILRKALEERNMSCARLAREIQVNERYVVGWKNAERLPNTNFVESKKFTLLAQYLKCEPVILENAIKEARTQGEFQINPGRPYKDRVSTFVDPARQDSEEAISRGRKSKINKPKSGIVFTDAKELAGFMIQRIEQLSLVGNSKYSSNKIYITYIGKKSIFAESDLISRWHKALDHATANNWHVIQLFRLDKRLPHRTFDLIARLLGRFKHVDYYNPRFFEQEFIQIPPYGLLVISGSEIKEAIIGLGTKESGMYSSDKEAVSDTTNSGIYIREIKAVNLLEKYCLQLEKYTKPIFNTFYTYENSGLNEIFDEYEDQRGDRYNILRRLSEITRPLGWYTSDSNWAQALLKHLGESSSDFSKHLNIRKKRAEGLINFLEKGDSDCYYIYPRELIDKFCADGSSFPIPNSKLPSYFIANPKERKEQLEVLYHLIDRYPTMNIAFATENVFTKIEPTFCEVKSNYFLFMELFYQKANDKQRLWVATNEKLVVQAFKEELADIWENLAPDEKDREKVKNYLSEKIKDVESLED